MLRITERLANALTLIFLLSFLPLVIFRFVNTAKTTRVVGALPASFFATRRTVVAAQIPKITATHLSAFKREGELEVMSNIIEPMTQEYICLIAGN